MMSKRITSLVAVFSIFCATLLQSEAAISDNHVAFFIFGDSLYDVGMTLYNGVNFASAGACVLVETRPQTINLKMQVDYFLEMVGKMKKQLGEADANKVLSKAVYMFSIGGNDYVSLIQANIKKASLSDSYKRQYMGMVLGNLTSHIRTIYNAGGRKFAFQTVGPIGCMPATKALYTGFVGNCVKEPQLMAKMHNGGFQQIVKILQSQLSGFKYSVFDYYANCAIRILYNSKYGFTESKSACCGTGSYNGYFTCGKNGTNFKVCSNPSNYLWFDAAHHSENAYQQFAQMYWSGSSNVVSPYNLKALVDMH